MNTAYAKPDNTVADWPLKFVRHSFGAACYSTYACKVRYNGFLFIDEPNDKLKVSSDSLGSDYRDFLSGGYLGVKNFPPPIEISWRSKNGQAHEAKIDLSEIFHDRLILHKVKREDIPEGISIGDPEIVLEVNDRTVNVYMRAFVPTKTPQIPDNPRSSFRDDLVLAWTKSY
ncbi:hypothetical protein [Xanthomonas hortorum]|uniref:Uncharacterized protein n=1 Tax=Xanthomonas hortorum TaxID=56454 RepID=A0AA47ETM4_9XANT|nr:hypothetical protein [Xanthomonas hortorum]WAH64138.1 hypothetical protein OEG85_22485 [Xanthomonas hortorum]